MTGDDPLTVWALCSDAATFVLDAALALAVGGVLATGWARTFRSDWASRVRTRSSTCVAIGAALALIAACAELWLRSASAADVSPAEAWPAVRSMLAGSHYGRAWTVGLIAVLVLGVAGSLRGAAASNASWTLSILGIAVFAYARAVVSHAAADGDVSLAVAVDWLHLLLIAAWVGMVFVAAGVGVASGVAPADRPDVAAWLRALSKTATLVLAGIVATGLFKTWSATGGSLVSLPGSRYGTLLFVKLAFVGVAVALGAINRFRWLTAVSADVALGRDPERGLRSFVALIRWEALALAGALATATMLGATEAPSAA